MRHRRCLQIFVSVNFIFFSDHYLITAVAQNAVQGRVLLLLQVVQSVLLYVVIVGASIAVVFRIKIPLIAVRLLNFLI